MKLVTTCWLLQEFGPCTATELRQKAQVKTKGFPASARLFSCFKNDYMTKKKTKDGMFYTLTKKGKALIAKKADEIESLEEIRAMEFNQSGSPTGKSKSNVKMGKTSEDAMSSFVAMLQNNQEAVELLRGIHLQIGNFLQAQDNKEQD